MPVTPEVLEKIKHVSKQSAAHHLREAIANLACYCRNEDDAGYRADFEEVNKTLRKSLKYIQNSTEPADG